MHHLICETLYFLVHCVQTSNIEAAVRLLMYLQHALRSKAGTLSRYYETKKKAVEDNYSCISDCGMKHRNL